MEGGQTIIMETGNWKLETGEIELRQFVKQFPVSNFQFPFIFSYS